MNPRMPVLFLGHGNPMNAITNNPWSQTWVGLGKQRPQPRAILAISAHWYTAGTAVTAMQAPRTIHDFYGFPQALFNVQYPAPGDPELAASIQALLNPLPIHADHDWGLDHGTWSILRHMFPDANIPVVQLSIDRTQPPAFHYELGQQLQTLRDEGVLIIGSGNIIHNLQAYQWKDATAQPYDWAQRFQNNITTLIERREHDHLINYPALGQDAMLSVPTPEHYLPLLYILGASTTEDIISFHNADITGGSISMLSVMFGNDA